jgi:hypothetical protein
LRPETQSSQRARLVLVAKMLLLFIFFASAGRAAAAKSAEARRLAMGEYQAKESD